MNAKDIMQRGHRSVMKAVDGFPAADWDVTGVCGVWSSKDVMSHLAEGTEHVILEAQPVRVRRAGIYAAPRRVQGGEPHLQRRYGHPPPGPDSRGGRRRYRATYETAAALLDRIAPEKLREVGTIPGTTHRGRSMT